VFEEEDERPDWLPAGEAGDANEGSPADSSAATPTPEGYVSRADYERLQQELEQERGRGQESRAWGDEAQHRYQVESAVRQELERMYREHSESAQRSAQMQPPQPEGIDDWLVDPQAIAGYVGQYGGWVRDTLLAQLTPFLQRLAMYDGVLPVVLGRAAEDSLGAAKRQLEEEGFGDFDELRPEIEAAFHQNPAGARLILDPSTIVSVYHYLARGRNVKPVKGEAKPVPSAGTSRGGQRTSTPPAVTSMLKQVAERLQINPKKLAERQARRTLA
jgi:hypothetical protein